MEEGREKGGSNKKKEFESKGRKEGWKKGGRQAKSFQSQSS